MQFEQRGHEPNFAMSFRLFIYYCGLCGAWAALIGWGLAKLFAPETAILSAMFQAMTLGIIVALALSIVDGAWNGASRLAELAPRVLVSVIVGCFGGLVGGFIGQVLFGLAELSGFVVFGWTLTGTLIGASVGIYDLVVRLSRKESASGAIKKVINGTIGGTLGGFLGSLLFLAVRGQLSRFTGQPADELLSSSAVGFVALGACIGLLIGLAQVILKEAWVRVEKGFRVGRELILTKPETIIGRAEGCDIGLFGGQGVEKVHARIIQSDGDYLLADASTPGGTFLNGERVVEPARLKAGDRIRLGNCELLFQERRKRPAPTS
jgi:hypothetical protein